MTDKIKITIDNRQVEVNKDIYLLEALREYGVEIPTLCNHPSLVPSGECRLCMVEVSGKVNEKPKMVSSCLFPVKEGMIVSTHSKRVADNRKILLKLYLANSPDSEVIKNIARNFGVDDTLFNSPDNADNCIKCGLCIRTCQNLSTGAISALNRSTDKEMGTGSEFAGDCTACLSCSYICPTGYIKTINEKDKLTIWNKEFKIPVCSVEHDKCTACGICEEVCPFAIPCISLFKNGNAIAWINENDCIGCGICAGACPNGAIFQKPLEPIDNMILDIKNTDVKGKKVIFSCSRSKTGKDNVVLVPCVGKVSIETVFECLAKGANSVAFMCRDQATCPYGSGGALGEKRMQIIRKISEHIGIDKDFAQFITPEYGKEGPDKAVDSFRNTDIKNPLSKINNNFKGFGFDKVLEISQWIKTSENIQPLLTDTYKDIFDQNGKYALYIGNEIILDSLLSLVGNENIIRNIIVDAVEFLKSKNISVKPVFNAKHASFSDKVYVISKNNLPEFSDNQQIIDINTMSEIKDKKAKNNSPVFNVSMDTRREIIEKAKKDKKYLCESPEEAAVVSYVLRKGSWQEVIDVEIRMSFSRETEKPADESSGNRISCHPIIAKKERPDVEFTFNDKPLKAKQGEVISSALYAEGITVFGHHHKDKGAQGIYCVNGQCSQCMVVANGRPVKSCMIPVMPGMKIESVEDLPELIEASLTDISPEVEDVKVPILIIGGGPAGIAAATELGRLGVEVLIVDDKQELGGKLSLQTHNFFGSVSDCWAGTRGMDIGYIMTDELEKLPNVKVWLNSTVVGVYVDKKFGVVTDGQFRLITAERTLISTGAREKGLAFPCSDLPGVYGAGAFQTLVNRDLIKCAKKLFIVGGGNVGLIGAYHALQVGIDVVGLVEALPKCGGYKVHEDKIKRLGVPVMTSHTILKAEGKENVEKVTIAKIDDKFQPIKGTERSFEVDTVLIAVGLSPVNEFLIKAQMYNMNVYAAGDAEEIAEASAAIFSGKIMGRKIAKDMGFEIAIPSNWESFGDILKHHSSETAVLKPKDEKIKVFPVIRCVQEIPCDPCVGSCPKNLISMKDSILSLPEYAGECLGCGSCVRACPGLAITLVYNNYDNKGNFALVMLPFEFVNETIPLGKEVITTDMEGNIVGKGKVIAVKDRASQDRRKLLLVEVPEKDKLLIAGFRLRDVYEGEVPAGEIQEEHDPIICRCERVRKSEIIREIRLGVRDMNQMKALNRIGMGGCGGKTCTDLILRIFREEGIPLEDITLPTNRPLVAEVHLGDFVKKQTKS